MREIAHFWRDLRRLINQYHFYTIEQILGWQACSRFCGWVQLIGSASLQDVFADQLLPQKEMSTLLSLPVIRQVRVAEPSLRICKSLSRIQSRISSPRCSWGWRESNIGELPLRSPSMSEEGPGLIKEGSNELCWVEVFGR